MIFIGLIFFCLGIILIIVAQRKQKNNTKIDIETQQLNENIQRTCEALQLEEEELHQKVNVYRQEINDISLELMDVKTSLTAIRKTQLREEELENNKDFYCIQIDESELGDIKKLQEFKYSLKNPRILSMLIWQTYYQKPFKAMAARVLDTSNVMGIYKITCLETGRCYIGQSTDIAKRWSDHAKCGLGIDTPQGNKLYKDMQKYGLENFTWELIEECSRDKLNEKEKMYIDLYGGVEYTYNSTKGNN